MTWHEEILPGETKQALTYLAECEWLRDAPWYLAGGTALALQAGHRSSVDLDFFTQQKDFSLPSLMSRLSESEEFIADVEEPGTLYGRLFGAKVSFITYPFFLPKEKLLHYGNVAVLDARDVAVMKIIAISQRGRKRDFVDVYWYAHNGEPLAEIIKRLPAQYPSVAHDYQHILKALLYFDDAEDDPMPQLNFEADWGAIKKYFEREVPLLAKDLLGIE